MLCYPVTINIFSDYSQEYFHLLTVWSQGDNPYFEVLHFIFNDDMITKLSNDILTHSLSHSVTLPLADSASMNESYNNASLNMTNVLTNTK